MRLPIVETWLEAAAFEILRPPKREASGASPADDFSSPKGEASLAPPDSMSWRVFKNPVTLFVGGVAAVVLELAEPRVRTGVWQYTSFRERPLLRVQRTAAAAMVAVYAARSRAEAMIGSVVRKHDRIHGQTPAGVPFRANDPALLEWVHATASFGIIEATHAYVGPVSGADRDRLLEEAVVAGRLFGAKDSPRSQLALDEMLAAARPALEPSDIVHEFVGIMREAELMPPALRPLQRAFVDAGVALVPPWARQRLGLPAAVSRGAATCTALAARAADRIVLPALPAATACRRMGLASDYLYRR